MPDVFTPEKRSQVMSRIRGKGNRDTELVLCAILRANKITGWRRHLRLFGRPDFTFRKHRLVIFVDGCFWHLCPKCANIPKNNRKFWVKKLAQNQERDRAVNRELRSKGWMVIRFWEHELTKPTAVVRRLFRSIPELKGGLDA
jgi:DNA mismatch endonuclease (patch repair protein)